MRDGLLDRLDQWLRAAVTAGKFILAFAVIMGLLLAMTCAVLVSISIGEWWFRLPLSMQALSFAAGLALLGATYVTFGDFSEKEKVKRGADESEVKDE